MRLEVTREGLGGLKHPSDENNTRINQISLSLSSDDRLSLAEFTLICRALFRNNKGHIYLIPPSHLEEMFAVFDKNQDGEYPRHVAKTLSKNVNTDFETCVSSAEMYVTANRHALLCPSRFLLISIIRTKLFLAFGSVSMKSRSR
jgi:hypothetical protein